MKSKRRSVFLVMAGAFFLQNVLASGGNAPAADAKKAQVFTVYRGKTAALTMAQKGKGKKVKTGKKYRYRVLNKKIATVSAKGRVKGKKAGTTKVILQKKSSKKKLTIKIKVVDFVKELRLGSATNIGLKIGQKKAIQAAVYPKTAGNRKLGYVSSNRAVVTVDSTGTAQAVGSGFATLTVTTKGTTKKGKKLSKKIQIYVAEDQGPLSVPTPKVPDNNSVVQNDPTPGQSTPHPGTADPGQTDPEKPTPTPEQPKTLEQAIKEIPSPAPTTLVAANFVVKDGTSTSTLYFINRNYQGKMTVLVDGMEMSSNSTVANVLHRLATEVTGKGTSVSINPGRKRENQYYDEKLGIWRDAILVTRPGLSDAWLITNRKNGQQYRLMAWEQDQKYGTPYGLIVTDGDTTSKIVVY